MEGLDFDDALGEYKPAEEQWQARVDHLGKPETHEAVYVVLRAAPRQGVVISTHWVSSGRPVTGKLKERVVCRGYKRDDPHRTDVFAATGSSVTSRLIDVVAVKQNVPTSTADVEAAYLQVPEREEAYCEPPKEWCELRAQTHPGEGPVLWRLLEVLN